MASTLVVASTRPRPNGGLAYPLTAVDRELLAYDALLVRVYKSRRRRETIQDFVAQGGADACGGKTFAHADVRISFNGKKKRFFVDPQNADWFNRLRSEIAICLGLGADRYTSIVISGGGAPITGSDASDIDKIVSAPHYTLSVRVDETAAAGSALPPAPTYALARPTLRALVAAAAAEPSAETSTTTTTTTSESTLALRDLVARLRDGLARRVPERAVHLRATKGYDAVRSDVLRELSSREFYAGGGGYEAFWRTARCSDVGVAINDLASDVAAHVCKIGESLPASEITSEIFRKSLIGCSIWDDWTSKMKRWRRRKPCRVPCPTDAPGCGYSDERLYAICAPIGSAVDVVRTSLIASSLQNPYREKPIAHKCDTDDGYSSDETPSRASLDCSRRKKHYRSSQQLVPARASELPLEPVCQPARRTTRFESESEQLVQLMPIDTAQLAQYIGMKHGHTLSLGGGKQQAAPIGVEAFSQLKRIECKACSSSDDDESASASSIAHLQRIECKTCGHGCPKCGTPLDPVSHQCPRCSAQAQAQAPAPALKLVECRACDDSKKNKKNISEDIMDSEAAPVQQQLLQLPEHGKSYVSFVSSAAAPSLSFRLLVSGKTEPLLNAVSTAVRHTVPAGKYTVQVVDAATGVPVTTELVDAPVLQRNAYLFSYDGSSLKQSVENRFEQEKLALASSFLASPDVEAYLEAHPSGVLFATANDVPPASGRNIADHFVSGARATDLLQQRVRQELSDSNVLMLQSDSKRSAFQRNDENSKVWNFRRVAYSKILGSAKHPRFADVVVIVIDAPIEELAQ